VAVHYSIHESNDALRIVVGREVPLSERLLIASFVAIFVATATGTSGLRMTWCLILTIVCAVVVFASVRQTTAGLAVTKLEFQTRGSRRRGGDVTLLTAKIQRLEFQEHPFGQQGIYAVTSRRDYCVVPFVDSEQAREIAKVIEGRFPGLAEMWRQTKDMSATSANGISGGLL
jgi:hypothetical protein